MRWSRAFLAVVLLAGCASAPRPVVSPAGRFGFHDAFWVNLHHFLYVAARAELNTPDSNREAVEPVRREATQLPDADRKAWQAAIDDYKNGIGKQDILFDDALVDLTNEIAAQESNETLTLRDEALARVLRDAAPIYRRVWWPSHRAANEAWIAAAQPLLRQHESAMAARMTELLGVRWPERPIRVDVSFYSNWAGAYTTHHPSPRVTASPDPAYQGSSALEILFHEPLHAVDMTLIDELYAEARATGKKLPRTLAHGIIFYTAGAETRRRIPGHVPIADAGNIWPRGMAEAKRVLDKHWPSYLDGQITRQEVVKRIVGEF